VPNVFTPNGDGINDFFFIKNENLSDYHLTIYNRWGQAVFESRNLTETWNGRIHNTGNECEAGVYFYHLTATRRNRKPVAERFRKGIVTLLR
jgi:gliding motility-associated-like protein